VSTCASSSARSSPERGSGARNDPRVARLLVVVLASLALVAAIMRDA
jgi:hypothetical protein